ncbi:MAG: hypothetical protein RQ715_06380 [Methylococcales bacterium]|nr:hypothetical protein [Methylococcales bacterium]
MALKVHSSSLNQITLRAGAAAKEAGAKIQDRAELAQQPSPPLQTAEKNQTSTLKPVNERIPAAAVANHRLRQALNAYIDQANGDASSFGSQIDEHI